MKQLSNHAFQGARIRCLALVLLLWGTLGLSAGWAQIATYGPVAEALQTSAHTKFLSADGKYYLQNNGGNTGFNYWWQAHGLDAMLDGYLRTQDDKYKQWMKSLLLGTKDKNGGKYPTYFYDDMAWLGVASLRAGQNTGDADYLNAANVLWQDMKGGQHAERGGAIQWNKGAPNSFNACTNGIAIVLATRLFRAKNQAQDLQTAKSIYAWMKGALVDPNNGAVWDSYDAGTGETKKSWIFSYNVGAWIGAGLELYKTTGEQSYLNDAIKSAEYAMTNRLTNGVFWTNETGEGDGGLFKGIFLRYFALLAREGNLPAATRDRYVAALQSTAKQVNSVAINKSTQLVSRNWTVAPSSVVDWSTQLSGIMLMEAAANLDKAVVYPDASYSGYSVSLAAGRYTTAKLKALGVLDNDISSLAVPKGYVVTVFDGDNFAGTTATFTANSAFVGGALNDKISSLIVKQAAAKQTGAAAFYQDCNYEGKAVSLPVGDYNLTQLQARGIANDDLSSVRVSPGYEVRLFADDNFQGASLLLQADNGCLPIPAWNDQTSSLRVAPAPGVTDLAGAYTVQNRNSSLFMDVAEASPANGAIVQQWSSNNGGSNQRFRFTHLGGGVYKVTAEHSGKALDVAEASTADGARLTQWDYAGRSHQQFTVQATGNGYYRLLAVHSGKVLGIGQGATTTGGQVQQGTSDNSAAQQWKLAPSGQPAAAAAKADNQLATAAAKTDANAVPTVYPNPVESQVQLAAAEAFVGGEIIIRDVAGRAVWHGPYQGQAVPVAGLRAGVYQLELRSASQTSHVRFVKQ